MSESNKTHAEIQAALIASLYGHRDTGYLNYLNDPAWHQQRTANLRLWHATPRPTEDVELTPQAAQHIRATYWRGLGAIEGLDADLALVAECVSDLRHALVEGGRFEAAHTLDRVFADAFLSIALESRDGQPRSVERRCAHAMQVVRPLAYAFGAGDYTRHVAEGRDSQDY